MPGLRRTMSSFGITLPLAPATGLTARTDCVAFCIVVRKTKSFALALVAALVALARVRWPSREQAIRRVEAV